VNSGAVQCGLGRWKPAPGAGWVRGGHQERSFAAVGAGSAAPSWPRGYSPSAPS